MAVLVMAEVPGQTTAGYDHILAALGDALTSAPGFLMNAGHEMNGSWRTIEVWESKQAADAFFAKHVRPNLPPGLHPKRVYQELHVLVTADGQVYR